jgi:hypothetical protein
MIKFFRKIRYQLLGEGNTGKYLKYAIGEILLVVIGILIALSINTWNEERKDNNEGFFIQEELFKEFTQNRTVLNERITTLENSNHFIRVVLSFMGKDAALINSINMDSIIMNTMNYGNYNPSNSTILELIQSGKLNLINNDSLKKNIYRWLQFLEDTDEDFKNQDLGANNFMAPYLRERVSFKNLNNFNSYLNVKEKSNLSFDPYYDVFQDIEFENLYYNRLFWNTVILNHFKELDSLAIEIINQTDKTK